MEKETIVKFEVEKSKADKDIKDFDKNLDKAKKSTKDLNKQGSKTPKILKRIGGGFKLVGTALKAAGIGIIIGLFAKLAETLSKNQKVVDTFNKVMTTLEGIFNAVFGAISDAVSQVSEATNGFESMKKVINGLITLALTPLKTSFFTLKLGIQEAQLLWEKSVFGSGDKGTIKELEEGIIETRDTLIDLGKDAIQAGKDIAENAGDAVNSIVEVTKEASKNVSEINVKSIQEQSNNLVELRKQIKLQEASLEGITTEYQRQAEELRQIRDNEEISINDRIEANDKLAKTLVKQSKEEKELAENRVSLLKQEIAQGDTSVETQAELIRAKNKIVEIEESITGQLSEQKVNEVALRKERRENLAQLEEIGKTEIELSKESARQQLIERKRLIKLTLEEGKERDKLLLEAQNDFNNQINEINKENIKSLVNFEEQFREEARLRRAKTEEERLLIERENERERFEEELEEIEGQEERKAELLEKFDDKTNRLRQDARQKDLDRQEKVEKFKVENVKNGILSITDALAQGGDVAKGFAVAEATWNSFNAINAALSDAEIPFPIRLANAIAVGANAFANVKSILNTDPVAGGGTAPSGGQTGNVQQSPRFDVVGDSNRLRDIENQENSPQKAFVVSRDVSTQQELDRNVNDSSQFI